MPFLSKYKNIIQILTFIVVVAFNLVLSTLPVFKYFSFEFTVANAILIAFLSGWIYLLKADIKIYLLLLAVPLLFGIYLSQKYEMCSFWSGMEFFIVFTLPAALIGAGLGALANLSGNKYSFLLYPFFYFFLLFSFIVEIYFRPNIYFFNSIIGFFPGTIYDESLQLNWKHYSYRLLNCIFFVSMILFDKKIELKPSLKKWSYLPFILVGLLFYLLKPSLGYSTNEAEIYDALVNRIETEHFIIFTKEKKSGEETEYLKMIHEYYFSELRNYFGLEPDKKISSYLFSEDKIKRELIGTGSADLAKPWRNEIYLNENSYQRSLKHEIAHVFAGELSTNYFKVPASFNSALIEGVAVAAEDNYGDEDLFSLIRLANENDYGVKLEKLFSGLNFFSQSSSRSYLIAGGFIKFIRERYGNTHVRKIYNDESFENVFEKSISQLEEEFIAMLDSISFTPNPAKAQFYFGRKAFIEKTCPRVIANKTADAFSYLSEKKIDEADKLFSSLLKISDDYNILSGKIEVLKLQEKNVEAIDLILRRLKAFEGTSYFYLLQIQLADLYAVQNNSQQAGEIYSSLSVNNPHIKLKYIAETRLALMELDVLDRYVMLDDAAKINFLIDSLDGENIKWTIPSFVTLKKYLSDERLARTYNKFHNSFDSSDFYWNYTALKFCELLLERNLISQCANTYNLISGEDLSPTYSSFYNEVGRRINYFKSKKKPF